MPLLVRLAAVSLAALVLATPAQPAARGPVQVSSSLRPQGLKAFLLRASDPAAHTFPRTPSFAWSPVKGAVRYEFELATSRSFTENGTVFSDTKVAAPVESIPIALPWITGSPYSLYAHVRAITRKGTTPWSAPFGFNVRWPSIPTPNGSYPGLLRWNPVPGANRYQVWFVDPGTAGSGSCVTCSKIVTTLSNVVDEREYYSLHQNALWTGTVHWRIRALRWVYGKLDNGLPAVSYGPWSPIYTSVNPAMTLGPLTAVGTISDTLSSAAQAQAHTLMPGFLFSGNQSLWGSPEALYRVYVFTDQDCLNMVFRGAVVGSPAYAPRVTGPLALPGDGAKLTGAYSAYMADGQEAGTFMQDGTPISATEGLMSLKPDGSTAPNVDLWDNDWPSSRYYWTVVPVRASVATVTATTLSSNVATGATTLDVADASKFSVGQALLLGTVGPTQEPVVVNAIAGNTLTLAAGVTWPHAAADPIKLETGPVQYYDTELPQEACASGRVLTFGKTSEPAVTGAGGPYASGLSPQGQLASAKAAKPSFYGTPLVAWQPAAGADQYEVQWGRKAYPWKSAGSMVTYATSATLSLAPGTWYYRVRGINFSLPGAKQQMSWSDPVAVVVAKPHFRVVR